MSAAMLWKRTVNAANHYKKTKEKEKENYAKEQ